MVYTSEVGVRYPRNHFLPIWIASELLFVNVGRRSVSRMDSDDERKEADNGGEQGEMIDTRNQYYFVHMFELSLAENL